MNRKIVVDINKPVKGQPLVWENDGVVITRDIHALLPELKVMKEQIALLEEKLREYIEELAKCKALAEQNAKDIRIDRGLEDE